jgi:hypothetical protein
VAPPAVVKTEDDPIDPAVIVIHEQALSARVRRYVDLLSTEHPFNKDIVFDKRDVFHELSGFWPIVPTWEAEEQKIWGYISNAVQSVTAAGTNERVLLQIRVSAEPLSSTTQVESDEAMAVVAFDGVHGDMKSCLVPPMADVPDLEAEQPLSGILVLCQPFQKLIGKDDDEHLYGAKAGALYTRRTLDSPLSTNTFRGTSAESLMVEQAQRTQFDIDRGAILAAAAAALAASALDDENLLEKARLEVEQLEIRQNEEAEILKGKQEDEAATSVLSGDVMPAAVVAAAEATEPAFEEKKTNQGLSPALEESNGLTEILPAAAIINNAAETAPPVAMDTVRINSESETTPVYPDDGSRLSTRENESGFERRFTDDIAPAAIMATPIAMAASGSKSLPLTAATMAPPQTIIEATVDPTLLMPAQVETVVSDLPHPTEQPAVAQQPMPQDTTKVQDPAALDVIQSVNKSVVTRDVVAVGSVLSAADLAAPFAAEATSDLLQKEPHRPLTSPVAAADAGGESPVVQEKLPVGAESLPTDSLGSLETLHLATMDAEEGNDVTEPLAAAKSAESATTSLHGVEPPVAAASPAQDLNALEKTASLPVTGMETMAAQKELGPVALNETVAQTRQINEAMVSKTSSFAEAELSPPSGILKSAAITKNLPLSSGAFPELMAHLALSEKHDPLLSVSGKGAAASSDQDALFQQHGPVAAPVKTAGSSVKGVSLLAMLQPVARPPSLKGAASNLGHETPVASVKKRRKKNDSELLKKKEVIGKMVLKKQRGLVLAAKGHPPTLENDS